MIGLLEALLSSTLEAAPALIFAALGATLSERAGVVNVGVEGMMRAGAFAAAVAALVMPTPLGVMVGMLAGAGVAAIHGFLCIRWRSDQVVSGMALNLVMLALGTFLLEAVFSSPSATPSITQLTRWHFGFLDGLPMLRAFSGHTALTWLAIVLSFAVHFFVQRTRTGLRLLSHGAQPQTGAGALNEEVHAERQHQREPRQRGVARERTQQRHRVEEREVPAGQLRDRRRRRR